MKWHKLINGKMLHHLNVVQQEIPLVFKLVMILLAIMALQRFVEINI